MDPKVHVLSWEDPIEEDSASTLGLPPMSRHEDEELDGDYDLLMTDSLMNDSLLHAPPPSYRSHTPDYLQMNSIGMVEELQRPISPTGSIASAASIGPQPTYSLSVFVPRQTVLNHLISQCIIIYTMITHALNRNHLLIQKIRKWAALIIGILHLHAP